MGLAMNYIGVMPRRRPRGHIQQRANGTFRVHVYAGVDPITKRPRYLTETHATAAEAEQARTRLLARLDERRAPTTNATVGYLLDRWLEVAELEVSTRDGYEGYIRRYIRPLLGALPLRKLTVDALDRFYAHLRARGGRCQRCVRRVRAGLPPLRAGERYRPRPDAAELVHAPDCARGLPLAPSSVRQVHFILRAALNAAVRWGWLPSSPAELARPPKFGHYDPHPPSPDQVARLVNAAWQRDPDFGAFLWLAMTTGARRGELCALRLAHVRFDERDLLIERSRYQRGRLRGEKDTKTHQSRRIALDDATAAILEELIDHHRAEAAALGAELAGDAYLFSSDPQCREPWQPDQVTQRFRRLARRVGVATTLHSFGRHYSATRLLAAGVDLRTVAGRLGHGGGGATTLRVYAAWVSASDQRAAEVLGASLPRPSSQA
jgi:integrase